MGLKSVSLQIKKLNQKLFARFLLITVLIAGLLTACGDETGSTAAPAPPKTGFAGSGSNSSGTVAGGTGPLYGANGQITVIAPPATGENIPGQIFFVKDNNIWQGGAGTAGVPPVTAKELGGKQLTKSLSLALAKSPAISPDGLKLAYAYSPEPEGTGTNIVIGQDIYTLDLKSSANTLIIKRDEPSAFLDNPYWSADGKYIYFDARVPKRDQAGTVIGEFISINRFEIATAKREKLQEDAREPVPTPDGKQVVFVGVNASTGTYEANLKLYDLSTRQTKNLTDPDPNKGFVFVYMPRLSPDGQQIAFSAIGGPDFNFNPPASTPTPQSSRINSPLNFGALMQISLKQLAPPAHGLPYDLWLIKPDGTGLKRLTQLYEDHTMPAWSSDSKKIAFLTGLALYTIDADGKNLSKKSDRGAPQAGFAWKN